MSSGFSRGLRYALAAALCAAFHASPALAEADKQNAIGADSASEADRDTARELALEALDLMDAKRWQEAHVKLERAYGLFKAPTVAVLSARALENVGKLVEAHDRYLEAANTKLDEDSPKPFRKAVKEAEREAERLSSELPRLVVRVEGAAPESVLVELDGQPLAPAEWGKPMPVNPGEHRLRARLRSQPASKPGLGTNKFVAERGITSEQVFTMIVEDKAAESPKPEPAKEPNEPGGGLAWLSLGVGAAGLATGVVAGVIMLDAKSQLDETCTVTCPRDQRGNLNTFRSARNVSFVGYSVGMVGLGLGIALLLQHSGTDSSPVVGVSDGGAQVGYRGRF